MIGWIVLAVLSWGTFFGMCWVTVFYHIPAVLFVLIEVLSFFLGIFAIFSETRARIELIEAQRASRNVSKAIIRRIQDDLIKKGDGGTADS